MNYLPYYVSYMQVLTLLQSLPSLVHTLIIFCTFCRVWNCYLQKDKPFGVHSSIPGKESPYSFLKIFLPKPLHSIIDMYALSFLAISIYSTWTWRLSSFAHSLQYSINSFCNSLFLFWVVYPSCRPLFTSVRVYVLTLLKFHWFL